MTVSKNFKRLHVKGKKDLISQNLNKNLFQYTDRVYLRYKDSDTSLAVPFEDVEGMKLCFERTHRARFGFISPEKIVIIESIQSEISCQSEQFESTKIISDKLKTKPLKTQDVFINGKLEKTIFYHRDNIKPNEKLSGPAVIIEPTSTIVVEPGWDATLKDSNDLLLTRTQKIIRSSAIGTSVDPYHVGNI
jgi:5-oxoprolinase (ATP-hydrolysing)